MKNKTHAFIYIVPGIVIFLTLMTFAFIMKDTDPRMSIVYLVAALTIQTLFFNMATDVNVTHIKRILKKNGLWQDEEIRKKDLPK